MSIVEVVAQLFLVSALVAAWRNQRNLFWLLLALGVGGSGAIALVAIAGGSYALLGVFQASVGGVWAFILHERQRLAREGLERDITADDR